MNDIVYRVWEPGREDYWELDSFNEAKKQYDIFMEDMKQWFNENSEAWESWEEFLTYADVPSLEKVERLY